MFIEVPGELLVAHQKLERDEVGFSLFDGMDDFVDSFADALQGLVLVHLHIEAMDDRDVHVHVLHDRSGSCMVRELDLIWRTISVA